MGKFAGGLEGVVGDHSSGLREDIQVIRPHSFHHGAAASRARNRLQKGEVVAMSQPVKLSRSRRAPPMHRLESPDDVIAPSVVMWQLRQRASKRSSTFPPQHGNVASPIDRAVWVGRWQRKVFRRDLSHPTHPPPDECRAITRDTP